MRRRQIANLKMEPFPLERVKPDKKTVTCPKCLKEFKPMGIKRHLKACRAGLVAPLAD